MIFPLVSTINFFMTTLHFQSLWCSWCQRGKLRYALLMGVTSPKQLSRAQHLFFSLGITWSIVTWVCCYNWAEANGLLLPEAGCNTSSVSNKDAIRLWHIWWWFHWASFRNQTTMIAITRGTKNEGACVTRRRLPSCSSCKSTAKRKISTYTDLQKALEDGSSFLCRHPVLA